MCAIISRELRDRVSGPERRRAEGLDERPRSTVLSGGALQGPVSVVVPSGYEDVVRDWRARFGDAIEVEVRDVHMRTLPIVTPIRRPDFPRS